MSTTYSSNGSTADTLTHALEDSDPIVRYAAVTVLGDLENAVLFSGLPVLGDHLHDTDPWVREQAIKAIQSMTDVAIPRYGILGLKIRTSLLTLTKDHDPFIRSKAIEAMDPWEISSPSAVDSLRNAEKDEVWLARSHARKSLLWLSRGKRWIERSRTYLRDEDASLRLSVVYFFRQQYGLGAGVDEEIIDLLIERLHDPDSQILYEVSWDLALTKDPKAIAALTQVAQNAPDWLRSTIRTALRNGAGIDLDQTLSDGRRKAPPPQSTVDAAPINHGNIDEFIALLQGNDEAGKVRAVLGLCWIPGDKAEQAIVSAAKDHSPRVRYAAVFALDQWTCGRQHSEDILQALRVLSEDPNLFVRRRAIPSLMSSSWNHPELRTECLKARADWLELLNVIKSCSLTRLNSPDDDRLLLPLLSIPYDALRAAVSRRIIWNCIPEQKHLLQGLLKDSSVRVRRAVVEQLGSHPNFVPLLLSALDDENKSVRQFAAQGLSQFGDASVLSPLSKLAEIDESEEVRATAKSALQEVALHAALPTGEWDAQVRDRLERRKPSHCK